MTGLTQLFLNDLHLGLGARMVPFAGYEMPVQYPDGVMREHLHTRKAAGLFDVSHMGQVRLYPTRGMEALLLAFERLMPVDLLGLPPGRQRYGLLTDDTGGILDDLMVARHADHLNVVVNAARKDHDIPHLIAGLGAEARVEPVGGRILLALQGPQAEAALAPLVPGAAAMRFMDAAEIATPDHGEIWITRSGYTGEDGFEISVAERHAEVFARALLGQPAVAPVGLGARDSLRLEAGLCLYGHDIDTTTSPVEAGLTWAIGKARKDGGARAGGFPGAGRILADLAQGTTRRRVGLRPEGRAPMREGTILVSLDGAPVGRVTSGGFGPSVDAPVAMGYVEATLAAEGTSLLGEVRGKLLPVRAAGLPFLPATFKR